ncbi:MAG: hypothetical protein J6M39_03365 [Lachnospiraceae bacterium]|nr:hypothetical protein [Lachnospiraceae bacterium]
MRRVKYIFVAIIIVFVLIATILLIVKNKNDNYFVDESKKEYYTGEGWHELVLEVAKKNNDWTGLPLSKSFRKKYNSTDGILGKIEFDTIELNPFSDEDNFIGTMCHLLLKKGKKEFAYIYEQKYEKITNLLDDVKLVGPIDIVDENGKELNYGIPFTVEWKMANIYNLARGNVYETGVAVTEKFHKKYPFFLDLFIHYSPLSYNRIEFLEKESDLDNNIAIFEVNSILECKRRKYEVKLLFDDKLYLDDAEVKLVKEEDYRGDKQYITAKVIYQNSNWENLELTDNFRKKYNSINGLIEDISEINIDIEMDSQTIVMNKEYINTFVSRDGSKVSYRFEFVDDEKGWVDDIKISKV